MIGHILKGWLAWQKLRIKYGINYKKVIIVLSGENHELDKQVLLHLSDFMKRKRATSAIVLCKIECENEWAQLWENDITITLETVTDENMELLYSYYSYIKFFDNIVFTYTDKPEDNMLGTYIRSTEINEEEAACLALYHLRHVPDVRR